MTIRERHEPVRECLTVARLIDPDNGPAKLLNFRVPVGVVTNLDDLASAEGVTRSQIIRRMLEEGIERKLQASA